MKRLILAAGVVAVLALSAPSQAPAAGLLRRLFRPRPARQVVVQRQIIVQRVPVAVPGQVVVRQRGFGFGRRGH